VVIERLYNAAMDENTVKFNADVAEWRRLLNKRRDSEAGKAGADGEDGEAGEEALPDLLDPEMADVNEAKRKFNGEMTELGGLVESIKLTLTGPGAAARGDPEKAWLQLRVRSKHVKELFGRLVAKMKTIEEIKLPPQPKPESAPGWEDGGMGGEQIDAGPERVLGAPASARDREEGMARLPPHAPAEEGDGDGPARLRGNARKSRNRRRRERS